MFGYFLVFTEEIAFKHFLFINITKSRFFLLFSDHANIRMSHTLKRNLTKLVYVRKEKNPKLKTFTSLLFQEKTS